MKADLWDAVTSSERIPRWFLPITGELKVGGSYQLEGHASGTVLSCDPPKSFTATWEYGGNVSWVDVNISGDGQGEGGRRAQGGFPDSAGAGERNRSAGLQSSHDGREHGLPAHHGR